MYPLLFIIITGTLLSYMYVISTFNGQPEIMMSEQPPFFVSQCSSQSSESAPIDRQGKLNVAVWNIYKQQKIDWQPVLTELTQQNDLVLLQEAKLNSTFVQYLDDHQFHVLMAKGFKLMNVPMGVMNLSTQPANEACAYQTTEPLIRFAKSTLVSRYPLSSGEQLLVINLHGVNFDVRLSSFEAQFKQILHKVTMHRGPVILAGDFNTWREGRMNIVTQLAQGLRLEEAHYKVDFRKRVFGLPLDHLYYRGLHLTGANSDKTTASDHNPIQTQFELR
ncbi:endonuclease/exonuclease/phosphatase family protein [Shewanella sp. 1_MG-2023]|uniref:endonuclease/exonuclease/phosphatase family protein n=1 Tax=unclassified Shewanella TaxID=196818 RepID=UPI0026E309C1|nr:MULTISPECIES: endonuclease/exonuclease/phosphatase family protein [unclassified Shewanella]MDO6612901.1 endonuclease/exonuclease/phosphatase family protein [Shewanella sp. 7_MG-2023]MDO6795227.1 endonuclease/exonuclease/phosphatase family protein [Shewanella sp. 1_MG-2023]